MGVGVVSGQIPIHTIVSGEGMEEFQSPCTIGEGPVLEQHVSHLWLAAPQYHSLFPGQSKHAPMLHTYHRFSEPVLFALMQN